MMNHLQNKPNVCPVCKGEHIIKFGFTYSRKLETYGQRLAQVYQCQTCLTKIAPNHVRQQTFFPKWLKDFIRSEIQKNPMLSCQDLSDMVYIKFKINVDRHLIYNWIAITGNIKMQFRLQKNWRTRREHFGKSGMSKEWFEKRKIVQKKVWDNPEYRKHMSEVHKHPQHSKEVVDFCLSLKDSGLSLRAIAKQANANVISV